MFWVDEVAKFEDAIFFAFGQAFDAVSSERAKAQES